MNRSEAIAVWKELLASNVADISWVFIEKKNEEDYQLEMKTTSFEAIREFEVGKDLAVEEDKVKGICIIY